MTEANKQRGVIRKDGPQLPTVDIEELKSGFTVMNLEAALAMQVGKLAPVGYEVVADFFRNEHERTTPAHNLWFMVEANIAGKQEDLQRDFPDVPRLAKYIVDHMTQNNQVDINAIKQRVSRPDYSFEGIRQIQGDVRIIFEALFKQKP